MHGKTSSGRLVDEPDPAGAADKGARLAASTAGRAATTTLRVKTVNDRKRQAHEAQEGGQTAERGRQSIRRCGPGCATYQPVAPSLV
jgi:hypothetical protein